MIQRLQKGAERNPFMATTIFYLLISLRRACFHQKFQVAYNESPFLIRPEAMTTGRKKGRGWVVRLNI